MNSFVKKLSGHSGCELDLLKIDENFVVRKSSSDKSYNQRLRKQCIKQMKFVSFGIFAPKIINHSTKNGLFYFDMEFIHGKTLAQYSSTILITEIADFIRLLFKNLYSKNVEFNPCANIIFTKKINELEKKLFNRHNLKLAFNKLKSFDWKYMYKSPCHGDLTLENIIITPNKQVYLIDFLDSFYNSWMIDVAKLLQDLEIGWSFRNQEKNVTRNLRLLVAKEALIEEIKKMENSEIIIDTIYHLLLLNIVRIYPYTQDEKTFDFLDKAIEKTMKNLNEIKEGVKV